jgi:filamentous hemagglutinin family protein
MSSEPGSWTFLSQRVAPATSRGGPAADGQRLRLTRMSFAVAAAFSSVALGNPLNPTVVVGSATFQSTANTLTVTNTNGAVINWRGFSIGQGEITRFIQPGALSQVLNRVTGGSPSVILGALQSNGRVFLINQNGIAFGPGAQVDVGGLVVSSLGLSNADFAAGRLNFTQQAGAGGIVNQGVIRTASGGLVALVAPNVENHGVIQAPNGDVILAAGKSANLVDLQRPQIQVEVNAADNQALNVGQLVGRNIGIYAGAIRHSGIANANTAALDEQGRVVFKAVGDTLVSGKVEAGNTAGAGGRVEILGNRVGLLDGARVDASGVTGGGTVLVGGDFQGRNPEVQNAQRTYVAPTATVSADALDNGDGGKVVVWADGTTRAYGSLSAHAGTQGGDGGLIETSGKQFLDVEGARIDARAAHGAQGTWLLDPTDITVVAAGANAAYADVDAFADPDVGGAGASRVSPLTLDGAGANVVLQAQNDITVTDAISLTTTPNANLTLQAGRSIAINNSVATNGSGNITMVANNTDNSETNAAGGALVGSGGTNRSAGAASLTVSGAISTGAGGAIKLVNSSASTLGGETGGVTVNSAITTGSSTASGVASGAITIAAGTTITLNPGGSLTTGNATVASTAGVDTAASGAINLTAVTGISGAGTATTGSATVDNAAGGADSAVSGGITLNVSGAGAINLVTAAALAAGGASVSNNTGGTSATTGNISLSASSINATVAIPEASGATTNTQGVVNATATGAGGGITLELGGPVARWRAEHGGWRHGGGRGDGDRRQPAGNRQRLEPGSRQRDPDRRQDKSRRRRHGGERRGETHRRANHRPGRRNGHRLCTGQHGTGQLHGHDPGSRQCGSGGDHPQRRRHPGQHRQPAPQNQRRRGRGDRRHPRRQERRDHGRRHGEPRLGHQRHRPAGRIQRRQCGDGGGCQRPRGGRRQHHRWHPVGRDRQHGEPDRGQRHADDRQHRGRQRQGHRRQRCGDADRHHGGQPV